MSNKKRKGKLYRHFDKNGILLYVGISFTLLQRTRDHSTNSFWYDDIVKITIEHYSTQKKLLAAEKKAIRSEKPLYNIQFCKTKIQPAAKRMMTLSEMSVFLDIKKRTLERMIADGRFPVKPINEFKPRRWWIHQVNEWLNGGRA